MTKIFSIYRSSAGSGKTRTLAKEYLKLALRYKADYFRYILAVTFTNKASQEMKDRILAYLDDFAKGRENELAVELRTELGFDDQTFREHSQATQSAILHNYSQFSISTIDAFFQKVIRSFTRESGLIGDYKLEVEQDAVLENVIDNLIDELGNNKELTDWIVDFAKENLENERAWDVRFSLIEFAKEIFREEFKDIEDQFNLVTVRRGFFRELKQKLLDIKWSFLQQVSQPARNTLQIIESNNWSIDDFSYGKTSGLLTFFKTFAFEKNIAKIKPPGDRIRNHFSISTNWPNKKSIHARDIHRVAEQSLVNDLQKIVDTFDQTFKKALSAELALKNFYVFGLISDIARKLKEYKDQNNLMLLADAPKFLNGVIQDSDTPFIYEKVGSFYRNYLIDEFQDTSGFQWKNFQPLITNGLDQGYPSLVVGDVKQAIYRWRGGDLRLLQENITSHIGEGRVDVKELDKNFRSSNEVVEFNNQFFNTSAGLIAASAGTTAAPDVYADVHQTPFKKKSGFVKINFIQEPAEDKQLHINNTVDEPADSQPAKWKQIALEQIPFHLEALQEKGVRLRDVAIIVRKNDEGQRIANFLLQYKTSQSAKANCSYDVVSNESLRIDGAASVNLLTGAMQYLLNPDNAIARAQLAYEFSRIHERNRDVHQVFSITNQAIFENNLPPAFAKEKSYLKKLGLIELTESLIEIFNLGTIAGELVYLQAFQDLVLDFSNRERNNLAAFLEWWEDNKHKKSIQIAGEVNAAQIITIHKSKGLQFKYVIIPFCSWALDHDTWQAPNLWVKSEEKPFDEAGFLPIKYAKNLEQSFFENQYREEKTKVYLDNLNLLYVAFTRAEIGMIIMSPAIDVRGAKDSVAGILYQSILKNENLSQHFSHEQSTFRQGEILSAEQNHKKQSDSISISKYHSTNWREKLVIKQSGSDYFNSESVDEKDSRLKHGIHIHTVLSRIKYASDIQTTLDQMVIEGHILEVERTVLISQLEEILKIQPVATWFSDQWEVLTEIPILLPGGKENRVDRLLVKEKSAIIIDYKTGDRKKTDNDQVLEYMAVLRQMNFTVEGFLLYLKEKAVVEVKSEGRAKVIKKQPNKDQLNLGF